MDKQQLMQAEMIKLNFEGTHLIDKTSMQKIIKKATK